MLIDDSPDMWKSNDSDELYLMCDEVNDVLSRFISGDLSN